MTHLFPRGQAARTLLTVCFSLFSALGSIACSECSDEPQVRDGGAVPPRPEADTASPAEQPKQNLLLITIDTLRADHLGCYGYQDIETPVIDKLAARGWRFENAFSASPVTAPSHATILTGTYPFFHGVRDNGNYKMRPSMVSIAEILGRHGYETAAFVSSFVLDPRFGLNQGFAVYNHDFSGGSSQFRRGVNKWLGHEFDNFERHAGLTNKAVFKWLDARGDEPFFLWVHYYDPHLKYSPPKAWRKRYPDRPYDGEIAYTDHQIGKLYDKLEGTGELDRTLLVVVADHGEGLGQHEESHGKTLFDPLIRVPLIIVPPGGAGDDARSIENMARTVDIAPTLLEMLRIEGAADFQGRSLVGVIDGKKEGAASEDLTSYSETHRYERPYRGGILQSLRNFEWSYMALPKKKRRELYDLDEDPGELVNVVADRKKHADAMQVEMNELIHRYASKDEASSVESEMDRETQEKLEALGYIDQAGGDP
jgi:arylsulfatase A-like enzyme